MTKISYLARSLALIGAVASLAACSDRVVEPASPSTPTARARTPLMSTAAGEIAEQQIVINPNVSQGYNVGGVHGIWFPAGSVCDPSTSSYGPGTWEDDCTPATQPITLTATTWVDSAGFPFVDFQPALRFAPSKSVVLYMFTTALPASYEPTAIFYCRDDAQCDDEAQADPSLTTYYDPMRGVFFRRVKHFSGYVVGVQRLAVTATFDLF